MTYLLLQSHRMCPSSIARYCVKQIVGVRLDSSSDFPLLCRHLISCRFMCLIAYPHVDYTLLHLWLSFIHGLLGPVSLTFFAWLAWWSTMRLYCLTAWLKYQMAAGVLPLPFWVMGCLSLFIPVAATVALSAVSVHAVHIFLCCPGASDDVILSFIHCLRPSQTIAAFALVWQCQIYLQLLFRFICVIYTHFYCSPDVVPAALDA